MKQKVLAILLSVVMLLGMLPVGIIAGANGDATEPALPAGTVGYVMDVPETEQFINWKNSDTGVLYFSQWHTNMLMNKNAANEADPFNAKSYPSSGGGMYVKELGGETYMVFNPNEGLTTAGKLEYADGTNDVNTAYGTINASNGKVFWNNISALENSDFTANTAGLVAIDDAAESGITHLAYRIKVVGGVTGQVTAFHLYDTNGAKLAFDYPNAYFLDINTGATYKNNTTDTVIVLPEGDFDGYMVLPVPTAVIAKLQTTEGMHIYTYAAGSTWWKNSNWEDRSLCFGDVFAVNDEDTFCAQYVVESNAPDDTAKNIFTVPAAGGKIYDNQSTDWGIARYVNETYRSKYRDNWTSIADNGEYFFPATPDNAVNSGSTLGALYAADPTTSRTPGLAILPATYSLDTAWGQSENALSELYSDVNDYSYVAMRFKTTGGTEEQVSHLEVTLGAYSTNGTALTDLYLVDFTTGKTTHVTSGNYITVPYNFDGWIIYSAADVDGFDTLGEVKRACFVPYYNSTSNWLGKTMYFGDMKILKDLDAFLYANGYVDYTVAPSNDNTLTIVNDGDAAKNALYSVDNATWYGIDAFNALTFDSYKYHTIYAKYPWSVNAAVTANTIFNADDTATELMPVDRDVIYYSGWSYSNGAYGLGFTSGASTRNSTNTGWNTSDGSSAHIFATTLDGEKYWEVVDNPDHTSCRQFNILPLYSLTTTVGDVYANASEFNYLAVRMRFEEDATGTAVEGATHNISLNLQAPTTSDGTFGKWANKNVYFYDITTGETTTVVSEKHDLPLGFNGYVIFPSDSVYNVDAYGTLSDMYRLSVFMHDADSDHGGSKDPEGADWTGTTLYIGAMELIKDDEAFLDVRTNCDYSGTHTLAAVEAAAPSAENNGHIAHYACTQCGATYADAEGTTPVNPTLLTFDAASLTLEQNITVNFKANAENLAGLTDVYAKVNFGIREAIIEAGEAVEGKYVFNFDEIGPHNFGTTITAQLFGTYGGTEYEGEIVEYSVKDYCYNKLAEYADATDKDEFKTLLVDLLNYGAKAQTYTGTDTSNLVNAGLKYLDRLNATVTPPTVNTGVRGVYDEIDETVTWNGVNLYFEDKASLKFRFTAASTEGLTVKVMDAKSGGNVLAEITEFKAGENGSSVALFNKLDATMMRDTVYVAVYNGETQVSEILAYSVVAYAGQKVIVNSESTTAQKNLAALVSHMIRYGDAAVAYAAANA